MTVTVLLFAVLYFVFILLRSGLRELGVRCCLQTYKTDFSFTNAVRIKCVLSVPTRRTTESKIIPCMSKKNTKGALCQMPRGADQASICDELGVSTRFKMKQIDFYYL